MRPIAAGQHARLERVVDPVDSAERYGNAGVRVLATPALCHWFESTAVLALGEHIEAGEATVGTRLSIEHIKATPIGMRVTVDATVESVEGRRVSFQLEAHDELELIARGTHERYVLALDRFLQGVQLKSAAQRR